MIKLGIQEDVGLAMSLLKLELQTKLEIQGHGKRERSKLIKSIEFEIKLVAGVVVAAMYAEDYYIFVEKGVKKEKIPFGRKTGKKTSKYIQGLIRYFRFNRGLGEKEARRASFATANKHKQEGMPTRNSFKYSKDGTRLGFVESTLKKNEAEVFRILERETGEGVEIAFTNMLDEIQMKFNS